MAGAAASPAGSAAGDSLSAADDYTVRMLGIRVNTVSKNHVTRVLQDERGRLLVDEETLATAGLTVPDSPSAQRNGRRYYALTSIPELGYTIDEDRQELVLDAGAAGFQPLELDGMAGYHALTQQTTPGGFFNYDIVHQSSDFDDTTRGTMEIGIFNALGTGTTTFLASDARSERELTRLNTTWRRDWPERTRTLSLGDTISRSASWGRSVQFAGIQWGTNFDTRPDFITFPLPRISGETTVPASIDLYTNDRRRLQEQLRPGPFSLENIPATVGINQVQMVIQDVLGRERVITRPFYVSQSLLRKGLQDFTYEAGAIRRNYAIHSNDYGRAFFAGTHRLGLSERLTGETRVELVEDQQTAGLGAAWLAGPSLGVITAAAAGSASDAGNGALLSLGVTRRGQRNSYGLLYTWAARKFRQLGLQSDEPAPEKILSTHFGRRVADNVSISLGYTGVDRRDGSDTRLVDVGLSTRVFDRASLHASLLRNLENRETTAWMTLSVPLGSRTSSSLSHVRRGDDQGTRLQLQRNLPPGSGFGYRLSTEDNDNGHDRHRATLQARTDFGSYQADISRLDDQTSYRLNASGGVAVLGGDAFVSRSIDRSFGVVRVGQYPAVRVYHENHLIDRTGPNGMAFIPDMRAFERNRVRVDGGDLPLDARIDTLENTAVPGYRQGALVEFDAESARGALVTLVQESDEPIPAGATVRVIGKDQRFPVARRGQAWVTGLEPVSTLEARWNAHRCTAEIRLPDNPGPVPRIGPVTCKETP
ncbi:fimbria/pilus outer membrane usher protein [Halomonas maura]|uniref:fimbria/pilus outer membrane usher protein n=1 Tax=Halomonas maura TaxID=117606 RepID=UPI0025B3CA64|nr:fimbria/pilus outer membrane usher protein [Halomonas maura]MDN3556611.1 fimbria/pilus outer membrane usher protein [Halomonas maura]